jgi:hypothetical protein
MRLVICISQKLMVSVRQKRKKKRPSRCLESRKKSRREGMVQVKKARCMIPTGPCRAMSSILMTVRVPMPAELQISVVRQEQRGAKSSRYSAAMWSMDQRKEISRRKVIVQSPFGPLSQ